jgi:hypothetical protein
MTRSAYMVQGALGTRPRARRSGPNNKQRAVLTRICQSKSEDRRKHPVRRTRSHGPASALILKGNASDAYQ